MLNAVAIGALWGAVCGQYFVMSPNLFKYLQVITVFLFVAIAFVFIFKRSVISRLKFVFSILLAINSFAWTAIHNPEFVSIFDRDLKVQWSSGCAESEHELLVHDGQQTYLARGAAMVDDVVVLPKNDIRSRFNIVRTTGYGAKTGVFCAFFADLRSRLYQVINNFPKDVRSWLSGFVLGRNTDVDDELVLTFRNIGLLHILVLSGGHLTVVAGMILFVIRLPFLISYFLKTLSVEKWSIIWNVTSFLACVLLFLFCAVVGFSPTVQRAFLSFLVCHIFPMAGLAQNPKTRIRLTICLQSLIFPVNLLSMSLILSWTGSLLLMAFYESPFLKSIAERIHQTAKIQLFFLATTLIFFGQVGILSPLANLLALPLFGILLPLDLMGLLLNINWLNHVMIYVNRAAVDWVRWVEFYQSSLPVSFIRIHSALTMKSQFGRVLILFLIALFYLLSGLRQSPRQAKRVAIKV